MVYTPPAYNAINTDLGSGYTPPSYNAINTDLAVAAGGVVGNISVMDMVYA